MELITQDLSYLPKRVYAEFNKMLKVCRRDF